MLKDMIKLLKDLNYTLLTWSLCKYGNLNSFQWKIFKKLKIERDLEVLKKL